MIARIGKTLCIALLLGLTLAGDSARAEFLSVAFESVWARFIFTQTAEGTEILARLSREGLALESAENGLIRRALEERVQRIGEEFRAKTKRAADNEPPLTQEERILLKSMAARELRINPRWSALERTEVEFLAKPPEKNFETQAEEFLAGNPEETASRKLGPRETPEGLVARMRKFLAEAKTCRENMPPPTTKQRNLGYTLRQLGIDEAMTAGGKILAAGSGPVQWKDLPADLAHEAILSLGTSAFSMTQGPTQVRWVKVGLFGTAASAPSAVIYSISPIKDQHAKPETEITLDRLKYDVAWSWLDALPQIKLYDLLAGMECMGKSKGLVVGLQVGTGLGSNFAYFGMRNLFIK